MIEAGEPLPDVAVWLSPSEAVSMRDLPGQAGALLLFYLFDWSST